MNQKSNNLVNLYVLNILDIITLLESELNIDYLFICILPISYVIYSELTKDVRKRDPIFSKSRLTLKDSPENRINSEKDFKDRNSSRLLSSSESNEDLTEDNGNNTSDYILNAEEINNNSINNEYCNYVQESKYDNKRLDLSKESNNYLSKKQGQYSADLNKSFKKLQGYKNNTSFHLYSLPIDLCFNYSILCRKKQ